MCLMVASFVSRDGASGKIVSQTNRKGFPIVSAPQAADFCCGGARTFGNRRGFGIVTKCIVRTVAR